MPEGKMRTALARDLKLHHRAQKAQEIAAAMARGEVDVAQREAELSMQATPLLCMSILVAFQIYGFEATMTAMRTMAMKT